MAYDNQTPTYEDFMNAGGNISDRDPVINLIQSIADDFQCRSGDGSFSCFNAVAGALKNRSEPSSIGNRASEQAAEADSIDQIVKGVKKMHPGWNYERALNHARQNFPMFFESGPTFQGTLSHRSGRLTSEIWNNTVVKTAQENENDVLDYIKARMSFSQADRMFAMTMTEEKAINALLSQLNEILTKKPSWDIDQAWEHFKQTMPEYFIPYVASTAGYIGKQ